MKSGRLSLVALVLTVVSVPGCATAPSAKPGTEAGKIITEEMIEGYSVSNAWEVLRKSGRYLTSRDDGPGSGTSIRSKRGKTSLLLVASDIPRVVVDGAVLTDLRLLRDIPAASIAWIQLLDGMQGTLYKGTNSGAGVIIIVSKTGY